MRVALISEPFDPLAELRAFQGGFAKAGALVSFTGYCRGEGPHGAIRWLELEHYPRFTEKEISRLASDLLSRLGLLDLLVLHRVGRVAPGEAIVLVATLSPHRAQAFAAVERLMDYLKTDAVLWKREMRCDGVHWIEPTEEDHRRRAAHDQE